MPVTTEPNPLDLEKVSAVPVSSSSSGIGSMAIQSASQSINPVERQVTDDQTVSGQMSKLLSSDSDFIKVNEQKARRQAHSRGMDDSSIGMGAVREAAINTALPIASQDAATFSQASQENTATKNQFLAMDKDLAQKKEYATHTFDLDMSKLNDQQAHELSVMDKDMDQFRDKKMLELDATLRQDYMNNATALRESSMNQIIAIYSNPELTAEQQKAGVAEVMAMSNSTQEWLAESMTALNNLEIDLGDIDLSGIILAGDSDMNGGSLAAAQTAANNQNADNGGVTGTPQSQTQTDQMALIEKKISLQNQMFDAQASIDSLKAKKKPVPAKAIGKGASGRNKKRREVLAYNAKLDKKISALQTQIADYRAQIDNPNGDDRQG